MKLTKQFLEDFGACEQQAKRFVKLYPNGLELTVTNLAILACTTYKHSQRYDFLSIGWLGEQLEFIDNRKFKEWQRLWPKIDEANDNREHETDAQIIAVLYSEVTKEQVEKAAAKLKKDDIGGW